MDDSIEPILTARLPADGKVTWDVCRCLYIPYIYYVVTMNITRSPVICHMSHTLSERDQRIVCSYPMDIAINFVTHGYSESRYMISIDILKE